MYCKNCNAFNEDGSRFCSACGAPLSEPAPETQTPLQGQYAPPQEARPPYQQPYYGAQPPMEPTRPLTIALPIVALILGILSVDIIGILLGAFSLVNFNRYTDAVRAGDFASAEVYKNKSRRLAIAGIVVTVILFVLAVIAAIVAAVFFGFTLIENGGVDSPLVEFNNGGFSTAPFELPGMIGTLL